MPPTSSSHWACGITTVLYHKYSVDKPLLCLIIQVGSTTQFNCLEILWDFSANNSSDHADANHHHVSTQTLLLAHIVTNNTAFITRSRARWDCLIRGQLVPILCTQSFRLVALVYSKHSWIRCWAQKWLPPQNSGAGQFMDPSWKLSFHDKNVKINFIICHLLFTYPILSKVP